MAQDDYAVILKDLQLRVVQRKSDVVNYVLECLKVDKRIKGDIDFRVYYPIPCDLVSAAGTPSSTKKPREEYADALVDFQKTEDANKLKKLCPKAAAIQPQMFYKVACAMPLESVISLKPMTADTICLFLEKETGVKAKKTADGRLVFKGKQWQFDIARYWLEQQMAPTDPSSISPTSNNYSNKDHHYVAGSSQKLQLYDDVASPIVKIVYQVELVDVHDHDSKNGKMSTAEEAKGASIKVGHAEDIMREKSITTGKSITAGTLTSNQTRDISSSNTTRGISSSKTTRGISSSNTTRDISSSNTTRHISASNTTRDISSSNQTRDISSSNTTRGSSSSNTIRNISSSNTTRGISPSKTTRGISSSNTTRGIPSSNTTRHISASNTTRDISSSNQTRDISSLATLTSNPVKRTLTSNPIASTASDDYGQTPVMSMLDSYSNGFSIYNRTKLIVHKCDITMLNVDAVVNLANSRLHHEGGIAKTIARAAGPELEGECEQYIEEHSYVRHSELVMTTGGRMPCCKVMHAVCPTWSESDYEHQQRCRHYLQDTFQNIMETAKTEHFKSLAIPAISSGVFGVPPDIATDIMCFTIMSYGPHQCLEEIHLVDDADVMLRLISNYFRDQVEPDSMKVPDVIGLDKNTLQSIITLRTSVIPISFIMGHHVHVHIYPHDITELHVDTIVCPADRSLSCSRGLAKVIADKYGQQYKELCNTKGQNMKLNSLDVIAMWKQNLPIVLHAVTPKWSSTSNALHHDKEMKKIFFGILDIANKNKIHTLAIPPFGPEGAPANVLGKLLCDALLEGLRIETQITEIHIVDIKVDVLKALVREMFNHKSVIIDQVFNRAVKRQISMAAKFSGEQNQSLHAHHLSYNPGLPRHADVYDNMLNKCVMCMEAARYPKVLPVCQHVVCARCTDSVFKAGYLKCSMCGVVYGIRTGDQPTDGVMSVTTSHEHIPGYNACGSIVISYEFPDGHQGDEHPSPEEPYTATSYTAYLPDNEEGNHVLGLLQRAFEARLVFTIGQSSAPDLHYEVKWNGINHKTRMYGSPEQGGYPDVTYLTRVRQELAAKGIK